MDKFDLKKFLTENKLTKTSVLREGFEETNSKPYDETYANRDEWRAAIKSQYPNAKPNAKFGDDNIWFDNGDRVAQWIPSEDAGKIYFNVEPLKTSPLVSDDPSNPPTQRSAYGFKNEEKLRTKIKEMIIAELSLTEGEEEIVDDTNAYNFNENVGEVGEKDYEDYQELKKFLNSLEDTKNPNAYTDDAFNYNSEIDPDGDDSDDNDEYFFNIDQEEELEENKFKLSEYFIDEAKKDEEEAPAEDAPEEEVDATLDTTDTGEDFNIDTSAVNPNIKAVQDALTQAQAAAKSINDDKLTQQIGNTITMFTRTHIANTEEA